MVFKKEIRNALVMIGVLKNHTNIVLDLILPRFCCSCKSKLAQYENSICNNCYLKINLTEPTRLHREFSRKFASKNIVTDFYSPFVFEKDKELQDAIHSLKYDNKFRVGMYLGEVLGLKIKEHKPDWNLELIIPIPLHKLKKAERGYNQSYFIAKGISKTLKTKCSESVVKRIKYTESQTTMNLIQREENIGGAFKVKNKKIISGKNILLIDDVITTGATISECGKVLLEAGAKKILAASVAIAD